MGATASPRRLAVFALVAVSLAAAAVRLPVLVDRAADAVEAGRPDAASRELAPADAMDVPNELVAAAQRVIPEDASYNLVLGPQFELSESQRAGVPVVLRYYLLPRRQVEGTEHADWVIAYGQSSETLGIRYRREVPLAEGVNALELVH